MSLDTVDALHGAEDLAGMFAYAIESAARIPGPHGMTLISVDSNGIPQALAAWAGYCRCEDDPCEEDCCGCPCHDRADLGAQNGADPVPSTS